MTRVLPAWQAFDPDRPDTDTGAPALPESPGPIVALLVSPSLHRSGWAPRAAARLAGRGIVGNGRILLADLGLEEPRLHEALQAANGEGMSDAFIFGASIQRIARPMDDGFLFVPAGTPVAEPGAVLDSPRWTPVLEAFRQAGAQMLLYLPWDLPGREALLARAAGVVVMAGEDEALGLDLAGLGEGPVHAVLGPAAASGGTGSAPGGAEAVAGGPGAGVAVEAAAAGDGTAPAGGSEAEDGPVSAINGGGGGTSAGAATGPGTPGRPSRGEEGRGRGRRVGILLLLVVLLVLGALAAAMLGLIHIPGVPELSARLPSMGIVAAGGDTSPAPDPDATPATAGEDERRETGAVDADLSETGGPGAGAPDPAPHQAWSLSIASYQDPRVGQEHAEGLQRNRPGRLFVLAPVRVRGETWYRLLVGPAEDSAAAEALRDGLDVGGSGWTVRPTPLAFQLAELPSAAEAREWIQRLPPELPAYVLAVPSGPGEASPAGVAGSGGERPVGDASSSDTAQPEPHLTSPGTRFRVYAGAYIDAAEASRMEEILREVGMTDAPLVPRVGTLLPPPVLPE